MCPRPLTRQLKLNDIDEPVAGALHLTRNMLLLFLKHKVRLPKFATDIVTSSITQLQIWVTAP